MPLKSISQIRRQEFVLAAREVIEDKGLAATTLELVAKQAGASKGIILHYFKNKQALFEETMRYGNAELRDNIVRNLRQANTPQERLWAVVAGNFDDTYFQPKICQAWLSLCADTPYNEPFRRLQIVLHARMHSNLVSALKQLLPAHEAQSYALTLSSLIDGLWLRLAVNPEALSAEQALAIVRASICHRIPGIQFESTGKIARG